MIIFIKGQKWVKNILVYDFEFIYKIGKQNVVENDFSNKEEDTN